MRQIEVTKTKLAAFNATGTITREYKEGEIYKVGILAEGANMSDRICGIFVRDGWGKMVVETKAATPPENKAMKSGTVENKGKKQTKKK